MCDRRANAQWGSVTGQTESGSRKRQTSIGQRSVWNLLSERAMMHTPSRWWRRSCRYGTRANPEVLGHDTFGLGGRAQRTKLTFWWSPILSRCHTACHLPAFILHLSQRWFNPQRPSGPSQSNLLPPTHPTPKTKEKEKKISINREKKSPEPV